MNSTRNGALRGRRLAGCNPLYHLSMLSSWLAYCMLFGVMPSARSLDTNENSRSLGHFHTDQPRVLSSLASYILCNVSKMYVSNTVTMLNPVDRHLTS